MKQQCTKRSIGTASTSSAAAIARSQCPLAPYRHGTDEAGRVGAVYTNASESCWQNAEWYGPVPVFKRDPIGSAMIPRRVSLHLSRKNKHACKLSLLLTLQENRLSEAAYRNS